MKSVRRELLNLILLATIPLVVASTLFVIVLGRRMWRTTLRDIETVTEVLHELVDTTLRESIVSYLTAKAETAHTIVDALDTSKTEDLTPASIDEIRRRLMELDVAGSGYIYVIDSDGRVVAHPDPNTQGLALPNTEPVETQLRRRNGYLQYFWQNSFEPLPLPKALYMVEYIPRGWIIAATAYRSEFVQLIETSRIAETLGSVNLDFEAYSIVVAKDGTFIAHPDHEGRRFEEFLSAEEARRVRAAFLTRTEGRLRYTWPSRAGERRRPKLMYFRHIPDFDWVVGTTVYLDSLRRPTVVLVVAAGLTGLGLFAVLALVAMRTSRLLVDPIVGLARAAEQGSPHRPAVGNPKMTSEVSVLIHEFNGFVDRIEEHRRQVADRERRLRRIAHEKTVLVREIHHRVKNNLQIIVSLISLQLDRIRNPDDVTLLERTRERVYSIALIHEKLLHGDDVSAVSFGEYLQSLVGQIRRAFADERISITVECDDTALEMDTAVPCGLIVNELTTNAIRHAFPGGQEGSIEVTFRSRGEHHHLEVSDTGIGIPQVREERLGLQLVQTLCDQLSATFELTIDHGTHAVVTIPNLGAGG